MAEKLLTTLGFRRLQAEYDYYWKVLRPETVQRVADAAAEGDRSENAEYIYGRKKLRQIDKRLGYLSRLLDGVRVVDPVEIHSDRVGFGATVTVEDDDGRTRTWTIVGEGESDPEFGLISASSPVARALWGKRVGDVVDVELPAGEIEYELLAIEYGGPVWQHVVEAFADWEFTPTL